MQTERRLRGGIGEENYCICWKFAFLEFLSYTFMSHCYEVVHNQNLHQPKHNGCFAKLENIFKKQHSALPYIEICGNIIW